MPTDNELRDFYRAAPTDGEVDRLQRFARRLVEPPPLPARGARRIRWVMPGVAAGLVAVAVTGTVVLVQRNDVAPASPSPSANVAAPAPHRTIPTAPSLLGTSPSATDTKTQTAVIGSIAVAPVDGAKQVPPNQPVIILAHDGALSGVSVTGSGGIAIHGVYSSDRTRWTSVDPLAYGSSYRVQGAATPTVGRPMQIDSRFTTVTPASTMAATVNISDGQTVGVAAPIVVTFPGPVTDRAAAERAMLVTTSGGAKVTGNWAWLPVDNGGAEAHWRPTSVSGAPGVPYWPAGTQVQVHVNLLGVKLSGSTWGKSNSSLSFAIRPDAQVVLADAISGQLVIQQNGRAVKSYPATYDGAHALANGVHVATEKAPELTMNCAADSAGCVSGTRNNVVRINDNGEMIFAAGPSFTIAAGTIVLGAADAADFYRRVDYGDPVVVSNSRGPALTAQERINDWTYTSTQWRALSAMQ